MAVGPAAACSKATWPGAVGARLVEEPEDADRIRQVLMIAGARPPWSWLRAEGYTNRTWIAETANGPVVVTHCLMNPAPQRLSYQAKVREELARCGLPVPRVLGEPVIELDNGYWQASECVTGDRFDGRVAAHRDSAAHLLARLHAASVPAGPPPRRTTVACWLDRPQALLQEVAQIADEHGADPARLAVILDRYAASLSRATELLDAARPAGSAAQGGLAWLPHRPIHGDVHGSNLRISANQVSALFDFDTVRIDVRVQDLADAAALLCRPPRGAVRRDPDPTHVASFLREYLRHEPLSNAELAALRPVAMLRWMPDPHLVRLHAAGGWDICAWLEYGFNLMASADTALAGALDRLGELAGRVTSSPGAS